MAVITASTGTAHHGGKITAGIFPRSTLKICRIILNGLSSSMHFIREVFALKYHFPLVELEQALVNVEVLHKRRDGADGHALAAGFRRN